MSKDNNEIPKPGDVIRTKKMITQGKVEKVVQEPAYLAVYFRLEDNRLMRTPVSNVTVIQKLEDEDKEMKEGGMGGINRCAPATDVSYEKVLDEVKAKWLEEKKSSKAFTSAALGNVKAKVGKKSMSEKGTTLIEEPAMPDVPDDLPPVKAKDAIDPWKGKPNKLARAPKNSMQGSEKWTFSQMVQDTINRHGVKWAFEFYVKKHGLPPRQFMIFSGLAPSHGSSNS